eukprot:gene32088-16610_t
MLKPRASPAAGYAPSTSTSTSFSPSSVLPHAHHLSTLRSGHPSTLPPTSYRNLASDSSSRSLTQHERYHPRCHRTRTSALPDVVVESLVIAPDLTRDLACLTVATAGAVAWVKFFNYLASSEIIDKFNPVHHDDFVLHKLLSVGLGVLKDDGLVSSVSRSGDRGELLKGPFYYCIVLISVTLVFWRDSPAGLMAISLMCGGDGIADIAGRRWGSAKLPYSPDKSWAGSAAMLGAGTAMSLGSIALFSNVLGFFEPFPTSVLLTNVLVICLIVTVVESLPINEVIDDNLSVPGAAILLSLFLLPATAS